MSWVLPHQLPPDAWVVPLPQPRKIGRHLNCAPLGCEEVQYDRNIAGSGARLRSEEVLEVGLDPRRLSFFVLDPCRPRACECDPLRSELVDPAVAPGVRT